MDMSLMRIGTLGAYMKNMEKQAVWQQKQDTGNYTAHGKTLEEWLESTRNDRVSITMTEEMEKQKELDDPEIQAIYYKVQTGKKLSAKEMEYLQKNDPEVYAKALSIQEERKAFERDLKRCKTQEDVQRLKLTQVSQSLSQVNEISNNPVIPLEKKLQYAMLENAKVTAIAEETAKFVRSGEYEKLPTEAEQNKALEEMREDKELKPEETRPEDVQVSEDENGATEGAGTSERPEASEGSETSEGVETTTDRQEDGIESEEEKKLKRAKAKAAYDITGGGNEDAQILAEQVVSFSKKI